MKYSRSTLSYIKRIWQLSRKLHKSVLKKKQRRRKKKQRRMLKKLRKLMIQMELRLRS